MQQVLFVRLEAPLMSFGGPLVDNFGTIQAMPALSMMTGLFGNALGYTHAQARDLSALQDQLVYSVACIRQGHTIRDYQTVDLGQDHLLTDRAWTTRGHLDSRAGGSSKGTHIRYRDYLADASYLVAVGLREESSTLSLEDLSMALERPARPLFLGRKTCLPSCPLHDGTVEADDTLGALVTRLRAHPLASSSLNMWWNPQDDASRFEELRGGRTVNHADKRDWVNQVHQGARHVIHGHYLPTPSTPTEHT